MMVDGYDRPQRTCIDCYNYRYPPKQWDYACTNLIHMAMHILSLARSSEESSEEEPVDQDTMLCKSCYINHAC